MDQGCHSNHVIHGYSDKGVGVVCVWPSGMAMHILLVRVSLGDRDIPGPSTDGDTHTLIAEHHCQKRVVALLLSLIAI